MCLQNRPSLLTPPEDWPVMATLPFYPPIVGGPPRGPLRGRRKSAWKWRCGGPKGDAHPTIPRLPSGRLVLVSWSDAAHPSAYYRYLGTSMTEELQNMPRARVGGTLCNIRPLTRQIHHVLESPSSSISDTRGTGFLIIISSRAPICAKTSPTHPRY
jgi:hypothetical protein